MAAFFYFKIQLGHHTLCCFWKDREITVGQIRSLTPTNTGVQMTLQNEKDPSVFMMRKKIKWFFLIILKKRA